MIHVTRQQPRSRRPLSERQFKLTIAIQYGTTKIKFKKKTKEKLGKNPTENSPNLKREQQKKKTKKNKRIRALNE